MARSTKTFFAQIFVALAMLFLAVALILWFISLFYSGSNPLGSLSAFAHFAISEIEKVISLILVFVLLAATYSMVWLRIGAVKRRPRDSTNILAIVSIVLGYIFLQEFVLLAGILLLIAWIVMIV